MYSPTRGGNTDDGTRGYARKHGSTQGIAERINEQFRQLRKEAEA
jgi:hypothetical protein